MTTSKAAVALADFNLRPSVVQSYIRRDGAYTVWLPQDKKTWRIDDKYGSPVCGPNGSPLRFSSRDNAVIFAAEL